MNSLNFGAFNKKMIFLLMALFYSVAGAQCIPYTGQAMDAGSTYCLNGNLTLTTDITIPADAVLIVQSGLLTVKGIIVNGNLEINDQAAVKSEGSIIIGAFNSQKNSRVKLGTKSYLSLTGSVTQGDPTFFGNFPGTSSTIEMGTNSVIEICGTFNQQSVTYPFVNYVGIPTGKAYCIAKAQVSGGGTSILSNDSQIVAIAMDSVVGMLPGGASFCGPYATQSMCPSLWPAGLPNDKLLCGNAIQVIDEMDGYCTKPAATGTPDGYTKFGITVQQKSSQWPENIPNGFIALESKNKGLVITRVAHVSQTPQPGDAVAEPKEGMMVYDIQDSCVKLYNGSEWKCIQRGCNE